MFSRQSTIDKLLKKMSLSTESLTVRRKRTASERVTGNGDPLVASKKARQAAKAAKGSGMVPVLTPPVISAAAKRPTKQKSVVRTVFLLF
jgi:hypothetical protein